VDALIIISRFAHLTGLTLLFGTSLFRLYVQPQLANEPEYWPRAIDISAGAITIFSALGWLFGVAGTMIGGWGGLLVPNTLTAVLMETHFGKLWTGRLALSALVMGIVLSPHRQTQAWNVILLLLSGALMASLAAIGHGSFGSGIVGTIHVVADGVHLLCAAAWVGALVGLAVILHRTRERDQDTRWLTRAAVGRFSRLGYGAVGLLLVTGIFNTVVLVPRPTFLVTSLYGRILLLKIMLVVVMIAIALYNRIKLAPLMEAAIARNSGAAAALYRNVIMEQAIGLFVLAIVAVIGTIHPPL
jgi:putative copper resistance protein D